MSDKILNPYKFKNKEKLLIKDNFWIHTDWSKQCFENIKKNIRGYLREEQNNQCCYCKRELWFDIKNVDIEHIAPKSIYSKFTFHPKNLALSCPWCNTKKSITDILVNRVKFRYPVDGTNFIIIHPHYDNYSDYIEILDNMVFRSLWEKWKNTIKICKLDRLENVEKRAREERGKNNDIHKIIYELKNTYDKDEIKIIMLELEKLIK